LCYHLVGAKTQSAVDLPAGELAAHLELVTRRAAPAKPWSGPDAVSSLGSPADRSEDRAEDRAVLVTFDDAFGNFYHVAWPLLQEQGVEALLFVPVGFVEGECGSPLAGAESLPPMSWAQLREVVEDGSVTVGSHSWTHPDMRQLDERALRRELIDSRDRLQEELGVSVRAFCYPRALWSRRVEAVVGEVYDYAFVAGGRQMPKGRSFNPLRIPRIPIRRGMPASIEPVLRSRVWLEEWFADKVRRYLR
jgi:peptidoglycan/xylan/chitin deacetylase (PgdA/CDA1 family)